jgi:hypothetical protein
MNRRLAAAVLMTGVLSVGVGGVASVASATELASSSTTAPTTTAPPTTGAGTSTTAPTSKGKKASTSTTRVHRLWLLLATPLRSCRRAPKRLAEIESALHVTGKHLSRDSARLKSAATVTNGSSDSTKRTKAASRREHQLTARTKILQHLEKRAQKTMARIEARCNVPAPSPS